MELAVLAFLLAPTLISSGPPLAPHPRLRLNEARLDEIRTLTSTDPIAAGMLASIERAGARFVACNQS
jgi:hypothetical protein